MFSERMDKWTNECKEHRGRLWTILRGRNFGLEIRGYKWQMKALISLTILWKQCLGSKLAFIGCLYIF